MKRYKLCLFLFGVMLGWDFFLPKVHTEATEIGTLNEASTLVSEENSRTIPSFQESREEINLEAASKSSPEIPTTPAGPEAAGASEPTTPAGPEAAGASEPTTPAGPEAAGASEPTTPAGPEAAGASEPKNTSISLMTTTNEIIVSDNFLRGTTDTLGYADTGQTWEELSGHWAISNNQAFEATGSGVNLAVVESNHSNGEVSVVFRNSAGNPRLIFRAQDINNYWYVAWHSPSQTLQLYKRMNGINQYMGGWLPTQAGSETRVALDGSQIRVFADSTMFLNLSDAFNQDKTKHGIGNTASTETRFSGFKIKPFAEVKYPSTLIASQDNMLVNYDKGMLSLSTNGGLTYDKSLSIVDISIIKYVQLFGNGSILFADHQKVYYSNDWITYSESKVINEDGTPFSPAKYDNFTAYKNGTVKKIVNGVEMAVWGSYSTESGIEFTDKIRVWYSADYGKTIKSAYVFNTPTTLPTRHVHSVDFNPNDNTFWIQTGDEPVGGVEMSHWVKGEYDIVSDSWNWTSFAKGIEFKTTNMIFNGDYVYWSWDVSNGGVVRAPIETMNDVSTHERIFKTPNDSNFIIIGPSGDIAVFQTVWGGIEKPRTLYYAPDGINFVRIVGDMPSDFYNVNDAQFQTVWPINNNGKILAGIQALSLKGIRDWGRNPSMFIDDFIRENGFPNAFRLIMDSSALTTIIS